jgi:aryl-alcohol dehydrogenase-like predicted oxidoreductase
MNRDPHARRLGPTLAFGTYRGTADEAGDRAMEAALARALDGGIRVIDSAINYRAERSERCIGRVLGARGASAATVRVITKAGYVPSVGPDHDREVEARLSRDAPAALGAVTASGHCLHPAWVARSVRASLANLGKDRVDTVLLHNPEEQLPRVGPRALPGLLREAFEVLERLAAEGALRAYGIATTGGLAQPPGAGGHLALDAIIDAARAAGGEHHRFEVVEAPLSLIEPELVTARTQPGEGGLRTGLRAIVEAGLELVVSSPLAGGRLGVLSEEALEFCRAIPGVGVIAVGATRPAHVDSLLALAERPPPSGAALARLLRGLDEGGLDEQG